MESEKMVFQAIESAVQFVFYLLGSLASFKQLTSKNKVASHEKADNHEFRLLDRYVVRLGNGNEIEIMQYGCMTSQK